MRTLAEVLQRYSQAFTHDPEQAAMDFYADDIVLRIPGIHPFAGTYRGRETAADALRRWAAASNGTLAPTAVNTVAFAPDAALVQLTMGAEVDGHAARWERVILYRLTDSHINEISFFEQDLHAVEDLFT